MKCKFCKKTLLKGHQFKIDTISRDVKQGYHYDCKRPYYNPYYETKEKEDPKGDKEA